MLETEELKTVHLLTNEYYKLFQVEDVIKKKGVINKSFISPFIDSFGLSFLGLCCFMTFILALIFGFGILISVEILSETNKIIVTIVFFIIIFAIPILMLKMGSITSGIRLRHNKRKKEQIEKELKKIGSIQPENYDILQQSYEVAREDATLENFVPLFYSEFLCVLLLDEDDPLLIESIKRIAYNIANTKFILESLNLQEVSSNNQLQENLFHILNGFKILYSLQKDYIENPELTEKLLEIYTSIDYISGVIQAINKIKIDKKLVSRIDSNSQKMREMIKDQPIAKSNIKSIRSPSGFDRDQFLSTLSALDEEIIEIRTRAGTYYASLDNIKKDDSRENRKIELLTDKELEVKLDVLNATLEMIEQEKQNMTDKEYQEIKRDNLTSLYTTKKALEKRKGTKMQIICPYCQKKTSPIPDNCKACKSELPYCIVCLHSLGMGEKVSICPYCQSFAHADHFREWLAQTPTCPYCKKEIKKQLDETILEAISETEKSS